VLPGGRPAAVGALLSCRLDTPRAPLNGVVTIFGSGFAQGVQVMIGGGYAPIVDRSQDSLQVRVPGSSGGGAVRVIQGTNTADCGTLTVAGR
jgi:hypothetical protein